MNQLTMTSSPSRGSGRLVRAGAVATVAAVLGNLFVYWAAGAITGSPLTAPHPQTGALEPVFLGAPIILTAVGIIGATVVFALLKRWTKTPVRTFVWVSLVVLVLSYGAFLLPIGLPTTTIWAFGTMHLVAAAIAVPLLIKLGA